MKIGTFSRIFGTGDKDLQKRADELTIKLSKGVQSASAKLCMAAKVWQEGKMEVLEEIQREIIELERSMDVIKEDIVENILTKSAFLPQQALERHTLVKSLDQIVDATENAVRVISMGSRMNPPPEIRELGKKIWECTDLVQDAVKYLFTDFSKSIECTRKLDGAREEARDVQFEILGKLYNDTKFQSNEIVLFQTVSERMVDVAVKAEDAGDYIRELAMKYS